MQAHPLSSPAARIGSTSNATPHSTPPPTQPRTRVLLTGHPSPQSASATLTGAAGLAHDAGNFLAALGLYCDLLSAPGVLRPEHQHYATELSLISNRSSELIQRLLAASEPATPSPPDASIHRSAPAAELASTSPGHASALRSLAPVLQQIAGSAAKVSVTCPTSLPPLDLPSEVIERIIVNLVRNAAQALRVQRSSTLTDLIHRGQIRVTLAVVASRLQLTVEDNGPGIPPAIVATFLQPSPLPPGATHGLGHRIVHELATATGGQLSIRVRPGNGTTICLKWPLSSTLPLKPTPEGPSKC